MSIRKVTIAGAGNVGSALAKNLLRHGIDVQLDLYLAGDDADARTAVAELARTLGFDPVDVGPLRNAAHLESLAILWIHLATVGKRGRDFAFKAVARSS